MSAKPVRPRPRALLDVELAIEWFLDHEERQAALGFIVDLETAYRHIGDYPQTGSLRYAYELALDGLRFWPLGGYPYLVFYVERDDHIDVWRVLQERRDIPASFIN